MQICVTREADKIQCCITLSMSWRIMLYKTETFQHQAQLTSRWTVSFHMNIEVTK